MTTSAVPAAKAALLALFQQSPSLGGVQCSWAAPRDLNQEALFFGKTTGSSTIAGIRAGRKSRDETFNIQVVISTATPGLASQDAEVRAFALLAVLEDLVANDPTLGGCPGVLESELASYTAGPDPDVEGYSGLIVALVTVKARLL